MLKTLKTTTKPKKKLVSGEQRHVASFETSNMLCRNAGMLEPKQILEVLIGAEIEFVLVGAHGIGGWTGEPRATQDVDVVVRSGHHKKAIQAVRKAFPELKFKDLPLVTRVYLPETEQVVLDLMKPTQPVCKAALKHCASVGKYRVPTLEMAIVMKFAAMVSPHRAIERKYTDASDFILMVKKNRSAIHRSTLAKLANLVYVNADAEILKLVDDAAAGKRLEFRRLRGRRLQIA